MPLTPEQQAQRNLLKILDYAFPITPAVRKCRTDLMKVQHARVELTKMIEAYRKGVEYKSPMLISLDLNEIRQMIGN